MHHKKQATDSGYAGLQAIASTIGLFANKYIALNHEWNITGNCAVRMHKPLMCPLHRHETMTGNMAGIGLPRNEGPVLHV